MNRVEEHYRKRFEEAIDHGSPEQDYLALDQSAYGTRLRHQAVTSLLGESVLNGSVLELGCGTGLWLESLAEARCLPSVYCGVDMFEERKPFLETRCRRLGVPMVFQHKPAVIRFEETTPLFRPTVVVAIGLCGYEGYHAMHQVQGLLRWMYSIADRGAISFPMVYDGVMGNEYLMRFDVEDIRRMSAYILKSPQFLVLEREVVLAW